LCGDSALGGRPPISRLAAARTTVAADIS
jgi:hypothetical protein